MSIITLPTAIKTIIVFLLILLVLWTGLILLLSTQVGRFLYPFSQDRFESPAFDTVDVPVAGDVPLPVAVHDAGPDAPVIFYLMGNYGSRTGFGSDLHGLAARGFSVIAMPYRGAERIPGTPSEAQLKSDALEIYDSAPGILGRAPDTIHILGYSLGSGIATSIAARRSPDSLILQASYASLCSVMSAKAYFPVCLLPWVPKWDNAALALDLDMPIFLALADNDRTIPAHHGLDLADALRRAGADLSVTTYPGTGHNFARARTAFLDETARFIGLHTPTGKAEQP